MLIASEAVGASKVLFRRTGLRPLTEGIVVKVTVNMVLAPEWLLIACICIEYRKPGLA